MVTTAPPAMMRETSRLAGCWADKTARAMARNVQEARNMSSPDSIAGIDGYRVQGGVRGRLTTRTDDSD
jgi:hypothetical protein